MNLKARSLPTPLPLSLLARQRLRELPFMPRAVIAGDVVDLGREVGRAGWCGAAGAIDAARVLGCWLITLSGTLKAAAVESPVVWITESDGALLAAVAVAALRSCVGWSSGWMDSGGACSGAAMRPSAGIVEVRVRGLLLHEHDAAEGQHEDEVQRDADREKARTSHPPDERAERAAPGIEKRKSGHREKPSVLWQGPERPASETSTARFGHVDARKKLT